jgi:glycosyltransferase involved in cell wall biosynthesis
MTPESISVIVPVFNAEQYLSCALDSILAQDYQPHELIVVDDGSNDATAEIAKSYSQVHYVHQRNQGPAIARNTGLHHATGKLISFLDADDVWLPGRSSMEINYLAAHPEAGCVLAKFHNFLEPGVAQPAWVTHEILRTDSNPWQLGTLLAHRWIFDKVGLFDQGFFPATDIEWFVRLVDSGIPFGILPEVVLHRRIHENNVSANNILLPQQRIRILKASIDRKREKRSLAAC